MKLYFAPGACSLSPHIVLREAGVPVELERVDLVEGRIVSTGEAFRSVNPKGYVPVIEVAPGEVVTEGAAIVQHIADSNPQAGLAPAAGTLERARVNEWLTFLSSELHKAFAPMFQPNSSEEAKAYAIDRVANRLDHIESVLADGRSYLTGEQFTIADAYLFTLTNWTGPTGIGLGRRSKLIAYMDRVRQRPAVLAALEAEGLLQPAA